MTKIEQEPVPVKPTLPTTWWEMAARWLFEQGVSTVLLASLLGAVVWRGPQIAQKFQQGYEVNATSLNRTTELYIDARDREITRIMDSHERDREAFVRAMQQMAK